MKHTRQIKYRALLLVAAIVALSVISSQMRADTGTCGGASITLPFTDVPSTNRFFCSIAAAYFSGLTSTSTIYDPKENVTREEIAAFLTRTLDQSLRRGGNRAALDQWWTPASIPSTAKIAVGGYPKYVKSDGADLWVAAGFGVSRVRASDGKLLETWNLNAAPGAVLVARGRIFATVYMGGDHTRLYSFDPAQPPGPATLLTDEIGGNNPEAIAYDGSRIWTANGAGGISIYKFICTGSCVTTVSADIGIYRAILYDGSHIWVTENSGTLRKLNSNGSLAFSITVGQLPLQPAFDGTNIWVPNSGSDSVTVVRVKDSLGNPLSQPFVLATLTGNGLNYPLSAAFDGQRILVANQGGDSVSLWKATNLAPLGSFPTGTNSSPSAVCSDGINFWIALNGTHQLARF